LSASQNSIPFIEEGITVPLKCDLSTTHSMAIRLLRERNAEMVARLAANTYTVIELGPLERDSSRPSPLRLENISIVRTFRSSKPANEAARELLNEKARGMTDPTCQEVSKEEWDGVMLCHFCTGNARCGR